MDQRQFEAMVKGTIFEDVMAVDLVSVVAPEDKVENEDAILGTMNDLEKGLYFLACQKKESFEAICAECKEGDKSDDEEEALCLQLNEAKEKVSQITELMWKLIEMRLGSNNMAIREDFQIESKKDGRLSGVHVIEIGLGRDPIIGIFSGGHRGRNPFSPFD